MFSTEKNVLSCFIIAKTRDDLPRAPGLAISSYTGLLASEPVHPLEYIFESVSPTLKCSLKNLNSVASQSSSVPWSVSGMLLNSRLLRLKCASASIKRRFCSQSWSFKTVISQVILSMISYASLSLVTTCGIFPVHDWSKHTLSTRKSSFNIFGEIYSARWVDIMHP